MVKVANLLSYMLPDYHRAQYLDPLLFLICVNDMTWTCSEVDIDLYADDSAMYKSGSVLIQIQNILQKNLFRLLKVCTIYMSLHPSKTKCMLIWSKHNLKVYKKLNLTINALTLKKNVSKQRVLDVLIEKKLTYHSQIDYICKELNKKIAVFNAFPFI